MMGPVGRGRISLFEQSRSDCVMVVVGLSPRDNGREKLRLGEQRLNRTPVEPFKRRFATVSVWHDRSANGRRADFSPQEGGLAKAP